MSILLVVERDTPCTSPLLALHVALLIHHASPTNGGVNAYTLHGNTTGGGKTPCTSIMVVVGRNTVLNMLT